MATLGVPTPVTGSHPGSALNPSVLHPGFDPSVISLNAAWKEDEYIYGGMRQALKRIHRRRQRTVGLMKPMVLFPAAMRASLIAERKAAMTGVDAEVPYTGSQTSSTATE